MIFDDKNPHLPVAYAGDSTSLVTPAMIRGLRYVDDDARVRLEKHPSLIAQIFPSAKQRMINDIQKAVLSLSGEEYLADMRIYFLFQRQAWQEDLNDRLMRGAATLRTETIKVAQAKLVEVSAELSKNQQILIRQLENDFEFCKTIKSSFLRSKYEDAIARHIEEVFDTFDRLSKHFKEFLDLRIGSAQLPAAA